MQIEWTPNFANGAPITAYNLRQQQHYAMGSASQLRADLMAWADDELMHFRTFHDTVLFGMANGKDAQGAPAPLATLAGGGTLVKVREAIAQMLGVKVKEELRRLRLVRPTIEAIDWAQHDEWR